MKIPLLLFLFVGLVVCVRNASVFTVYRAATTTSTWYTHLVNANAADRAGALSYLHTEVIPFNNRPPVCTRRWNYDIIAIYEVTVLNPSKFVGGSGPTIGIGFSAMDQGACTVPGCQERYEEEGFFVGGQTQKGNCRAAYGDIPGSAYWYSFPAEGQCAFPDGSNRCTYTARYVGKIKIDDLINSKGKQIDPNFNDWCLANGWEFQTSSTDCSGSCNVQWAIDFWKAPCDQVVCQKRVDMLRDATSKTSSLINRSIANGCDGSTLKTFKFNGQCVRNCPSDTYLDWDYNCVPCNYTLHCSTCNWATAPPSETSGQGGTRCLSCAAEYPVLTMDGQCISSCPAGQYFAQDVKQCMPCSPECSECSDNLVCTRCLPNQWLMDGSCLSACPPGFFGDDNASCLLCDACGVNGTCNSATECTSCGTDYHITPAGKCVSDCPERMFLENHECKSCHPTCVHCSGTSEMNCTKCDNATMALEAGRCVANCSTNSFKNLQARCTLCESVISGCSRCIIKSSSAPTCLACGAELALRYLHDGLCKIGCPAGFFAESESLNSTFVCVIAKPTNAPTSVAPTSTLAINTETSSSDEATPAIIGSVIAVLLVIGIVVWRVRVYRQNKLLLAPQELYEPLN